MNSVSKEILDLWNIQQDNSSDDYDQTADADDENSKPEFDDILSEVADKLSGLNPPELSYKEIEVKTETDTIKVKDEIKKEEKLEVKPEKIMEVETNPQLSEINEMAETIIKEELGKTAEPEIDVDEIFSSSNKGNEEENDDIEEDADASIENIEPQDSQMANLPEEPQDSNIESQEDEDEAEQHGSEKMSKTDITSLLGNSDITWLLDSPLPKYDKFYEEKRKFLPSLLPGGVVPVSKYEDMLRRATVNIDIGTYDADTAHSKMMECQHWRNHLQEVFIHVNSQYRRWDRAVELFRGVLARIEYEKPAARQEGVIYQHMRDMEMYLENLEGLHDALNHVIKNIESAWETMSRRVTIALPSHNREAERFSPQRSNACSVPTESPEENIEQDEEIKKDKDDFGGLDDFDSLGHDKPIVKKDKETSTQVVEF